MGKGITPVIATILLLLVVIGITTMAIIFLHRLSLESSNVGYRQLNTTTTTSGECLRIETVAEDGPIIRNCGTETLSTFTVLVDSVSYVVEGIVMPGEIKNVPISIASLPLDPDKKHTIQLKTAGAYDSASFDIAAFKFCKDGTPLRACSASKPLYCNNNFMLIENSTLCGCYGSGYAREDGSCTVYPHIKLFNYYITPSHSSLDTAENEQWKSSHSDLVFVWSYRINDAISANPNIKILNYRNMMVLTDSEEAISVPQFCLSHGCNPENFYYHYKTDYYANYLYGQDKWIYGWNPSWTEGDPPASATSINQSHMVDGWKSGWLLANINSPDWEEYNYEYVAYFINATNGDAVMIDNADFYAPGSMGINKTSEYWNVPQDGNHPLIQEYFQKQYDLRLRLEQTFGRPIRTIGNARAFFWYTYPWFNAGYNTYITDIQFENWMKFVNGSTSNDNPTYNSYTANLLLLQKAKEGKCFYLTAWETDQNPTDRSKMFFLSSFYLINHPNIYFLFNDGTMPNSDVNGTLITSWTSYQQFMWIPAVEYDIGQATGDPYEWTTGTDPISGKLFHITARDYDNVLVLVKWRPIGASVSDATATTHALPQSYRILYTDGTISAPVTSISLRNNEGVMLIK